MVSKPIPSDMLRHSPNDGTLRLPNYDDDDDDHLSDTSTIKMCLHLSADE